MPDDITPTDPTADPVADVIADMATPPATQPETTPAQADGMITMSNAEFNARQANHRRGLQNQLEEANRKAAAFETLQTQVSDLLESGLVDNIEGAGIEGFRVAAEKTIAEQRSEAEKARLAAGAQARELDKAQKAATAAVEKFQSATIDQKITNEAADKARSPEALELIRMKLRSKAKFNEATDAVTFLIDVTDEDGNTAPKEIDAKEAVAIMEANVTGYGGLFKSTVNGGGGGEIALDGVRRAPSGAVDITKMTMEQFNAIEDKTPGAVGASLSR